MADGKPPQLLEAQWAGRARGKLSFPALVEDAGQPDQDLPLSSGGPAMYSHPVADEPSAGPQERIAQLGIRRLETARAARPRGLNDSPTLSLQSQ
jgi:hypothetical protein